MNNEVKAIKPKRKKTILIFGISSFLGSNLAEFFKDEYKVVGTYNKNPVRIPGILTIPCDVLQKDEVQLVLFAFRPDITIYAVGMSSVVDCALEPERADALNTSGLFNVVDYCARYKSQICFISSANVFAGEKKNYLEMDIPDPNTIYGKTQASAEFYIQKTSLNYILFRSSKLYGRSNNPKRFTWFDLIQMKLSQKEQIELDDYVSTGYLDVYYLAMILKICFDREVKNRLFQVSSTDQMTLYNFTKKYAEIFNDQSTLITKGKWSYPILTSAATHVAEKFYFDLDVSNLEGFLNIKLPSIEESLNYTFKRLHGVKKESKKDKNTGGVNFI
ncbi:sugar nucleotide-binding protein [Halobacteriovorax sp. GB3]|uniref:SDR family oxidoreductase n=1 Tax=Halobacteriovorax sp. GB3 TaxID=2719615 RepID=UPI0023627C96|nr:sugar nucleotide-binding protein [Halobacteriovorax sp. GB3]MDD0854562.1 sugar nucleotide-binding protein [Halobacteriovorax sp. GB3]